MYLTDSRRLLFRGHLDLKNSNERGQTYLGIDIGDWRVEIEPVFSFQCLASCSIRVPRGFDLLIWPEWYIDSVARQAVN